MEQLHKGDDYTNTLQYSTDNGTTWLDVPATGKVTLPADGSFCSCKSNSKRWCNNWKWWNSSII